MVIRPVRTMAEAEHFLFKLVPQSSRSDLRDADSLARTRRLMERLDNPQHAFKSVHIAGTSGKGTTAYITSALLTAAGKTVGLHVSPHVYDFRERLQINGRFVSKTELVSTLNRMLPIYQAMGAEPCGYPTYFELSLALALVTFREHHVDYAVIETGKGGLFDASNTILRLDKLAVITQIGLDHTRTLGATISAIAHQKAGIIQRGNHVIALSQNPKALREFAARASEVVAKLEYVDTSGVVANVQLKPGQTTFDLRLGEWNWKHIKLGLTGQHQATNAAVALRTVQFLTERDHFVLGEDVARKSLIRLQLPARFEIRRLSGKTIILDGAHNPQKLGSLVRTLEQVFPGKKVRMLLAMTDRKNSRTSLELLTTIAKHIYLSRFSLENLKLLQRGVNPNVLASQLDQMGYHDYSVEDDATLALRQALGNTADILVITGSFYLISSLEPLLRNRLAPATNTNSH